MSFLSSLYIIHHLSNWKHLLTNSKVNFIAYYLVDKQRQNDPTLPFEYMSQHFFNDCLLSLYVATLFINIHDHSINK